MSAVRFGNHNEEQTGTKFFWGLFTFEQNTLLVLFRKTVFAYFFYSTQPVVAKFFTVSYIVVLHGTIDIFYKTFRDFLPSRSLRKAMHLITLCSTG
jgi:hypothetical protein